MPVNQGFWVDISGLEFHDADTTETWIQALPMGEYEHPFFGPIKIDKKRVQNFANNVKNNVRTQQLDIDYDHKATSGEAAGWVKAADARSDGLYLLVDWTKPAVEKIKSHAYKYFSPEIADEWTHPKSNKTFKDVLFGGALTNRPFLKDILPINMSEVFEAVRLGETQEQEEGKGMDPKELRKLLGLSEDATDAAVTAKLSELMTLPVPPAPPKEENNLPADIAKLAEDNPAIKKLTDMFEQQGKSLAEAQVALKLAEVDSSITKLSDAAKEKGYAFPPATLDEIRKLLTEAPNKDFATKVFGAFEKMGTTGLVELGERGSTRHGEHFTGDAVKSFQEAIKAAQKDDPKMDYADAVSRVSLEQPELFEAYRQASFANVGDE